MRVLSIYQLLLLTAIITIRAQDAPCKYYWHVILSLTHEAELTYVGETIQDIVSFSENKFGNGEFDQGAFYKLTWVLAKGIGEEGTRKIDMRATSHAKNLGVRPETIASFKFWDNEAGSTRDSIENVLGREMIHDDIGWSINIKIRDVYHFGPLMITSKTAQGGKYYTCESHVVLRSPLSELLDLSEEYPFVVLGHSMENGVNKKTIENEVVGDNEWNLFVPKGSWGALELNYVLGSSWTWFAIASKGIGDAGYLSVWKSGNIFQDLGQSSISALDLTSVYPFVSPLSDQVYNWDLDPFEQGVYENAAQGQADGYHQVSERKTQSGPCDDQLHWYPQIYSLGRFFVASTSWGAASRVADDIRLSLQDLNENWTALAPLCSKIIPRTQVDPVNPASAHSVYLIPTSPNLTVPFTDENYNISDFDNVKLPTIYVATSNEHAKNVATYDQYFHVNELTDKNGKSLAEFLDLDNMTATIVGIVSCVPCGADHTAALVKTGGVFVLCALYSPLRNEWKLEYSFPARGFVPHGVGSEHIFLNELEVGWGFSEEEATLFQLSGIHVPVSISTSLYVWGNILLLSRNGGKYFTRVTQVVEDDIFEHNETVLETMSFHNDQIIQMVSAFNGWIAVLTQKGNLWLGREGSNKVTLHSTNLPTLHNVESYLNIFFDEVSDLFVIGFESRASGLLTLKPAIGIDYSMLRSKDSWTRPSCWIKSVHVHSQYGTDATRELYCGHSRETTIAERVVMQNASFVETLPERIFLDSSKEFSFTVRLYTDDLTMLYHSQDRNLVEVTLSDYSLVSAHIDNHVDLVSGLVEYKVTLQDLGALTTSSFDSKHARPGLDLGVTKLRIAGRIPECEVHLHQDDFLSTFGVQKVLELDIYSGCPPLKTMDFDPIASKGGVDHGCDEAEEDICLFYHTEFQPVFQIIDHVSQKKLSVAMGVGELLVVGGGLTYDTIEDYEEDTWTSITQVVTASETPNMLRWVCLVQQSPCYYIIPSFPNAPEYFFKLRFRILGSDSYCTFDTEFTVRVHNLPITIETILITNFATIGVLLLGLIFRFRQKQQMLARAQFGVQDVDVSKINKAAFVRASETEYSSSDESSDEDSDDFG